MTPDILSISYHTNLIWVKGSGKIKCEILWITIHNEKKIATWYPLIQVYFWPTWTILQWHWEHGSDMWRCVMMTCHDMLLVWRDDGDWAPESPPTSHLDTSHSALRPPLPHRVFPMPGMSTVNWKWNWNHISTHRDIFNLCNVIRACFDQIQIGPPGTKGEYPCPLF